MKEPDRTVTPLTVEDAVPHLRKVVAWNKSHPIREDKVFVMLSTELVLEMCERLLAVTERKTPVATEEKSDEVQRLKKQLNRWKHAAIEGWIRITEGDGVAGRSLAQEAYDRAWSQEPHDRA
jgi:hypothetical protein